VKQILRRCSLAEAEVLVLKALEFSTAKEVENYLKSEIAAHFSDSFD